MSYVIGFFRFWYAFVVGDDWRVAAALAAGLAGTWFLAHADIPAWWLMPLVVIAVLGVSLVREVRRAR